LIFLRNGGGSGSRQIQFPFSLLADEDKSVIEALAFGDLKNLWEKNMMVFTEPLCSENSIEEVISDVKTKAHAAQILK
jgi:peroxiredoxin Q/BCP